MQRGTERKGQHRFMNLVNGTWLVIIL